jgi:hypothetical protein
MDSLDLDLRNLWVVLAVKIRTFHVRQDKYSDLSGALSLLKNQETNWNILFQYSYSSSVDNPSDGWNVRQVIINVFFLVVLSLQLGLLYAMDLLFSPIFFKKICALHRPQVSLCSVYACNDWKYKRDLSSWISVEISSKSHTLCQDVFVFNKISQNVSDFN